MGFSIGYYGIPGTVGGPTHLLVSGKRACGCHVSKRAQFQWCCFGIRFEYIECKRCRVIAANVLAAVDRGEIR